MRGVCGEEVGEMGAAQEERACGKVYGKGEECGALWEVWRECLGR